MRLDTERLIIREFEHKDIETLVLTLDNLEITRHLLAVPHPYTRKDAEWWIDRNHKMARDKKRESYDLAIQHKEDKALIGGIGLASIDYGRGTAEIGYWLNPSYHQKGYMSEAVKAIIDFGFDELKLKRINLKAHTDNDASNALAKKIGFVYEETAKKAATSKATGIVHDENRYRLLREDWQSEVKK